MESSFRIKGRSRRRTAHRLAEAQAGFGETWSPPTVATVNDYDVRVVQTAGEFIRHAHPDTDGLLLVLSGSLTIRMPDGKVELGPGPWKRWALPTLM